MSPSSTSFLELQDSKTNAYIRTRSTAEIYFYPSKPPLRRLPLRRASRLLRCRVKRERGTREEVSTSARRATCAVGEPTATLLVEQDMDFIVVARESES